MGRCGSLKENMGLCVSLKENMGLCVSLKENMGLCVSLKENMGLCGSLKENMGLCGSLKENILHSERYLAEEIKKRDGFRLVMEPEYTNVCFWHIPPSLRGVADGPEFWKKVHLVASVVKERMMKKGSKMVGYQPHGDKANFFRQIIISPQVSREDMDFLLDQIDSLGMDL